MVLGTLFALAEVVQLVQRNIYVYVADSSSGPRYLARGFKDKLLKRFLRQHFTPLCRSLPHPLPHLPLHLWDPPVLPGDGAGAVHQPGRGDGLEEDLSPLWRSVKFQYLLATLSNNHWLTSFFWNVIIFFSFSFILPLFLSLPALLFLLLPAVCARAVPWPLFMWVRVCGAGWGLCWSSWTTISALRSSGPGREEKQVTDNQF